jgi:hypothetical protein
MADEQKMDLRMTPADLYREDVYTDRHVGMIRQLTPVTPDGAPDPARPVIFSGQAQLMTAAGVLPITFDIDARSLAEAVEKFGAAAQVALEDTVREIQELRRQASSGLVIPDAGTASAILGGGGELPPGPGGGKIRLR